MKKSAVLILVTLFLGGCGIGLKKSGLEIISYPEAKVFVNGKESGITPYKNNSLTPGEVEVKLVTNDGVEWSKKVHLENGANTVVNRELSKVEDKNGGYILYLESTGDKKKAGLLINTQPDKVAVAIDGEIKGFSPMRLDDIGSGDKQVTLSFPGLKTEDIFIRSIPGYQLIIESELANEEVIETQPTPTSTSLLAEKVRIKSTETGWLRVRKEANANSAEISKVNPGEKYNLLETEGEWYKIDLGTSGSGWISTKYADKENN